MDVKVMQTAVQVTLVDINPSIVAAWRTAFADVPEVEVIRGSLLEQAVDAWVSPTNERGTMDGGVDAAIKRYLGAAIEKRVRREIALVHGGRMPVGHATCVETGGSAPRFLISTPTMGSTAEDIRGTYNSALACASALHAAHLQNVRQPGSVTTVAVPGLGAATGRVTPQACARLMRAGYDLATYGGFLEFDTLAAALRDYLGDTLPSQSAGALVRRRTRASLQTSHSFSLPMMAQ